VDLPAVREPAGPTDGPGPFTAPTVALPEITDTPVIEPGMTLPMPDDEAGAGVRDRLATLEHGGGLGVLAQAVEFAAATQGTITPQPWRAVRVLLLHGDHEGGVAAGDDAAASALRAEQAAHGAGALGRLVVGAAASLQVVPAPTSAAIEHGPALDHDRVEAALRLGWCLAGQAADDGVDALVLASCGTGGDAAAAAVLAALAGAEPAAVLARVLAPGGRYDDAAWMARCAAVRDALHRTRHNQRDGRDTLIELAGGDIAVATGVLLGAAARQLPVLLDGPVGVAAAVITRELAGQARHWCLLPDHGRQPGVRLAAEVLSLDPLFDLRVDLGEGATTLIVLPLLRAAVALAASLPTQPAATGDDQHAAGIDDPTGTNPTGTDRTGTDDLTGPDEANGPTGQEPTGQDGRTPGGAADRADAPGPRGLADDTDLDGPRATVGPSGAGPHRSGAGSTTADLSGGSTTADLSGGSTTADLSGGQGSAGPASGA
jgi:NaMN:DMB phosphoribosyltransferase